MEQQQQQQQQQHHNINNEDSRFSCNVCFDAVQEPVVTQCGHLYCWPCLYRWLEPGLLPSERQSLGLPPVLFTNFQNIQESRRVCPVCKAPCSVPTLVPIYVRNTTEEPISSNSKNLQSSSRLSKSFLDSFTKCNEISASTCVHYTFKDQEPFTSFANFRSFGMLNECVEVRRPMTGLPASM